MVGIPLFAEQPDNVAYMRAKGAAVTLDWKTMSSADLLNALKTVIHDPSWVLFSEQHIMYALMSFQMRAREKNHNSEHED